MGEIIKTIILGIVEGLTEFIPVSSTAHLLLTERILGIADTTFWQAFAVWSHRSLIVKVIVGFIPTGIVGVLLYPLIKGFLSNNTIIAIALIVGGVLLITLSPVDSLEYIEDVTYKQAFWIGVAQVFSVIPGMSRSGSTLIGGTWLGIPRSTIVTFTFLLGIPTILGASAIELRHVHGLTHGQWGLILLGSVVAFIIALLTIKFFISLLTKKPLAYFGWYRIAIGIITLIMLK
jgi:undecaprenyl-diphosphatase